MTMNNVFKDIMTAEFETVFLPECFDVISLLAILFIRARSLLCDRKVKFPPVGS